MENENMINKLRIKKGATLQTIILTLIVAMFTFTALFLFVQGNSQQVGIAVSPEANQTYNSLTETKSSLKNISEDFNRFGNSVDEVSPGDFGYYGLKGVLGIMKIPFQLISLVTNSMQQMFVMANIPSEITWAITLIISFIIVFAAISFLTNRGKDQT